MKAIHNAHKRLANLPSDVLNISKILNESNSQHGVPLSSYHHRCSQYFKDTK